MTIFRNIRNGRLYKLYEIHRYGSYLQSEDLFTGVLRKLNQSSWKRQDFMPVAHR